MRKILYFFLRQSQRYIFLFFLLLSPLFLLSAQASEKTDPVEAEEQYSQKEILQDFLASVFSADVLNSSYRRELYPWHSVNSYSSKESIKSFYPWIYDHVFPEAGLPKFFAVNKWVASPRISFGMPNDLKVVSKDKSYANKKHFIFGEDLDLKNINRYSGKKFEALEKHLQSFIKPINAATGLEVKYVPHDKEPYNDYSEIRINLVSREHFFSNNEFKANGRSPLSNVFGIGGPEPKDFRGVAGLESSIKTAFVYSANDDQATRQVDGYFVTNKDNQIKMAFCFIWEGHEHSVLLGLINECVARSMGVPGVVNNKKVKSLFNVWNNASNIWMGREENAIPHITLPSFDRALLQMLYDPRIKPGMDYIEAQKIIIN